MVSDDYKEDIELKARPELLETIDRVAKDKNITFLEVITSMEQALNKIASNHYGLNYDIRTRIHKSNGAIILERYRLVVEELENKYIQILLEDAVKINPDIKVGEYIIDILPSIDFNRMSAWSSREIISQGIKRAEKEREYELYKSKEGEIINGIVKRKEPFNTIIDLMNAEGFIKKNHSIPRENLEVGTKIRALLLEVKKDLRGPQIFLSRASNDFVAKLFSQEIPEVYDGIIEIKAISRDPGSRCKVALKSSDSSIDAVVSCIGFKGSRIQGIIRELRGEKIDLIEYSENIGEFVSNAFYPAEVSRVVVDEDRNHLDVVINAENLSAVIGRGGQNIKLISQLIKWKIDVVTYEDYQTKLKAKNKENMDYFMKALDVDEEIATLLALDFNNVSEIIASNNDEFIKKGFDEDLINELKQRSSTYRKEEEKNLKEKLLAFKVSDELFNFNKFLHLDLLLFLAENHNIKTIQDLADLSTDELLEYIPRNKFDISLEQIEEIIIKAREVVYSF